MYRYVKKYKYQRHVCNCCAPYDTIDILLIRYFVQVYKYIDTTSVAEPRLNNTGINK